MSIIIPVYNEENTINNVLQEVYDLNLPHTEKEIIVVDDGSTDASKMRIQQFKHLKNIKIFYHTKNQGKGAAIMTGIRHATGEYIVIQDADTEYNPKDIKLLLNKLDSKHFVVYGTRLHRLPNMNEDEVFFFFHYFGNRFLSFMTSVLYGQWLTDMETCYKLFPRKAVSDIQLQSKGFAFEPEITAKLLKHGYHIIEVPIHTRPRSYKEGKKLQAWKEGPIALWTLLKFRFLD